MSACSALKNAAAVADRWQLAILTLVAPAFLFPSLRSVAVLFVVPGLWIVAYLTGRDALPRTPCSVALLILILMVLTSVHVSVDLAFALPKIAGVLLGIATYYAIVRWVDSSGKLWLAAHAFMLAGGFLSVVALFGTDWSRKFPVLSDLVAILPRVIRGLPGAAEGFHPNAVGGALTLFVPLQVALVEGIRPDKRASWPVATSALRPIYIVVLGVSTAVLFLTQSRGSWLACGAGLVLLVSLRRERSRRCLALVAVLVLGVLMVGPRNSLNLPNVESGSDVSLKLQSRMEVWQRAFSGIRDFPITGLGMNEFRRVMPVFYPSALLPPGFDVAHAHNHLLQVALDVGVPGMIAYLALWIVAAHMLVSAYRLTRDPWTLGVIRGLGAGFVAHFLYGTSDAIALGAKVGIVFWAALGLVTALFRLSVTGRLDASTKTGPCG